MNENQRITIDLKSESMNEMLSNPPSWIILSGNGLFFLMLALIFGLTWFIKYPDEITGEVIISTIEPPIELSNQIYVQLKVLAVNDQQKVIKGEVLAQFDNQAESKDILTATIYLNRLETINLHEASQIPLLKDTLRLGSFQQSWIELQSKIKEWNMIKKDELLKNKIQSLQNEIKYRQQLQNLSKKKIVLSEKDYLLIKEELLSSERLAKENVISRQTFNQEKRVEIQVLQTLQSQKEQVVQNMIELNDLKEEIIQMKHDYKLQEDNYISTISSNIALLQNAFREWERSAVWLAPCDGKVLFNKELQINRFYASNEATIVIVPEGNRYIATATIPSYGAGKIKLGQKTFIELIDYPASEFGMLEGIVVHVMQIEKEGKYEVKIMLPKQLRTTYNKRISLKAQLKGSVKIITKKKRLLERFFEGLTGIVK
jgi:multidrug efflux pump subunit AcrA (membrane-fusion protein)